MNHIKSYFLKKFRTQLIADFYNNQNGSIDVEVPDSEGAMSVCIHNPEVSQSFFIHLAINWIEEDFRFSMLPHARGFSQLIPEYHSAAEWINSAINKFSVNYEWELDESTYQQILKYVEVGGDTKFKEVFGLWFCNMTIISDIFSVGMSKTSAQEAMASQIIGSSYLMKLALPLSLKHQ